MMEFFLSGSLPLTDFVICDVMSDMANKLLSLSLSLSRDFVFLWFCMYDGHFYLYACAVFICIYLSVCLSAGCACLDE